MAIFFDLLLLLAQKRLARWREVGRRTRGPSRFGGMRRRPAFGGR
jgi:hypothetical protein